MQQRLQNAQCSDRQKAEMSRERVRDGHTLLCVFVVKDCNDISRRWRLGVKTLNGTSAKPGTSNRRQCQGVKFDEIVLS